MKIRSPLRGGLPSFYNAKVLLPLIFLGEGVAIDGQGGRIAVDFILPWT
jgi:hypothetical protein